MTIRGPDPDKSAYRFVINREITRWRTDLRPRWVAAMDEESAKEIDAEFENCLDPNTMDDVTHAKDTAEFLKRHLDQLEHALGTREQLRANQAKFHALIAKRDLPGPEEAMRRARANIKGSVGQGLDPERLMEAGLTEQQLDDIHAWRHHPLYDEADGQRVTLLEADAGFFMGKPAVQARFVGDKFRGIATWVPDPDQQGYDPIGDRLRMGIKVEVQFALDRRGGQIHDPKNQVIQVLQALEITKVDPQLLHTNFPELTVKVPKSLPEGELDDLTDEARDEAQARLEQAQRLAGIYNGELDDRDVRKVMADDDKLGATAASKSKKQARSADYVNQWSDKPISEPGKAPPETVELPENATRKCPKCKGPVTVDADKLHPDLCPYCGWTPPKPKPKPNADRKQAGEALKFIYEAAGLEVETLAIGDDVVHVKFKGKEPMTTKLPEPLSKLLEE